MKRIYGRNGIKNYRLILVNNKYIHTFLKNHKNSLQKNVIIQFYIL